MAQTAGEKEIQNAVSSIIDIDQQKDKDTEPSDTPKPPVTCIPTGTPKPNKTHKPTKGMKTTTTEPCGGFDEDKKSKYFDAVQKVENDRLQKEMADSEMKRYYDYLQITRLERELELTQDDINMVRRQIVAQAPLTDLPILSKPNIVIIPSEEVDDFDDFDVETILVP